MSRDLSGTRVFIVEDESLVTMLLEDELQDMRCEVAGTACTNEEALRKIESVRFDAAILDVNLNGERSFAIAQALDRRGIPYVFATGYGAFGLPAEFSGVPILPKPFDQSDLVRALESAVDQHRHKPAPEGG